MVETRLHKQFTYPVQNFLGNCFWLMGAIVTGKLFTKASPSEVQSILLVNLAKSRSKNFPQKSLLSSVRAWEIACWIVCNSLNLILVLEMFKSAIFHCNNVSWNIIPFLVIFGFITSLNKKNKVTCHICCWIYFYIQQLRNKSLSGKWKWNNPKIEPLLKV